MLWLYVISFIAGVGLGIVQARVFYKGSRRAFHTQAGPTMAVISQVGTFLVRYVGLFVLLWVLLVKYHLNVYAVMGGFFVAFWGVILKSVKGHYES